VNHLAIWPRINAAACAPIEARREWASGDGSIAWINGRLE